MARSCWVAPKSFLVAASSAAVAVCFSVRSAISFSLDPIICFASASCFSTVALALLTLAICSSRLAMVCSACVSCAWVACFSFVTCSICFCLATTVCWVSARSFSRLSRTCCRSASSPSSFTTRFWVESRSLSVMARVFCVVLRDAAVSACCLESFSICCQARVNSVVSP